ncbi:hypothetical protein RRG08_060942 [Elysia crispata]|uniref:Uncharacterized protein n=1 Tax=Elysia crispata TaxID=231223 RepID=A0AAE1AVS0_9GAST|nr:hypothetical protein RRG08_060942 [Elysia crispata]
MVWSPYMSNRTICTSGRQFELALASHQTKQDFITLRGELCPQDHQSVIDYRYDSESLLKYFLVEQTGGNSSNTRTKYGWMSDLKIKFYHPGLPGETPSEFSEIEVSSQLADHAVAEWPVIGWRTWDSLVTSRQVLIDRYWLVISDRRPSPELNILLFGSTQYGDQTQLDLESFRQGKPECVRHSELLASNQTRRSGDSLSVRAAPNCVLCGIPAEIFPGVTWGSPYQPYLWLAGMTPLLDVMNSPTSSPPPPTISLLGLPPLISPSLVGCLLRAVNNSTSARLRGLERGLGLAEHCGVED